jgi:hypothetical protein
MTCGNRRHDFALPVFRQAQEAEEVRIKLERQPLIRVRW